MITPPPSKAPHYVAIAISQIVMLFTWAGLSYGAYWLFEGNGWFWFLSILFALDIALEIWKKPIAE